MHFRIVLLLMLMISAAMLSAKEDAAAKAEAALIAREDEEAGKLDGESMSPLKHFDAKGKLTLYGTDDPEKTGTAIGVFTCEKGTFIVRASSPTIQKLVEPYDKKEVTLIGKLRGEGKYFIVDGVGGGGAPPVAKTNRKRI